MIHIISSQLPSPSVKVDVDVESLSPKYREYIKTVALKENKTVGQVISDILSQNIESCMPRAYHVMLEKRFLAMAS